MNKVLVLLLLFFSGALLAAQETESPEARKLRRRAEVLYQHFLTGDWVKVDAFVAEESRNAWAAQQKTPLIAFRISSVTVNEAAAGGRVTALIAWKPARASEPLTSTQTTEWVRRNGEWYVLFRNVASPSAMEQVFRKSSELKPAPAPAAFEVPEIRWKEGAVQMRIPFKVTTEGPAQVADARTGCNCLKATLAKMVYAPGEKGELLLVHDKALPWPSQPTFEAWILFLKPGGVATIKVIAPEKKPPANPPAH